jgi:hypothetical protein
MGFKERGQVLLCGSAPEVAHTDQETRAFRQPLATTTIVSITVCQAGEPQPVVFQNHRSCVEHAAFVQSEYESFVALGALQEQHQHQHARANT